MWLAEQSRERPATSDADLGVTTIAGGSAGVVTRGEVRQLPVFGPGGYVWMPESGGTVLVIKGGPGGEEQCVAGMKQADIPTGMRPGDVYLHAGDAAVWLRSDGTLELRGNVQVTGRLTINGAGCNAEQAAL
jgi:hypothetical protein